MSKGTSIKDIRKIFGFFIHSPPCPHWELIYSIKFMQPPLLRPLLHDPCPPSDADIISGCTPTLNPIHECEILNLSGAPSKSNSFQRRLFQPHSPIAPRHECNPDKLAARMKYESDISSDGQNMTHAIGIQNTFNLRQSKQVNLG